MRPYETRLILNVYGNEYFLRHVLDAINALPYRVEVELYIEVTEAVAQAYHGQFIALITLGASMVTLGKAIWEFIQKARKASDPTMHQGRVRIARSPSGPFYDIEGYDEEGVVKILEELEKGQPDAAGE